MSSDEERVAAGLTPMLSGLSRELRAEGVRCGVDELLTAHRALAEIPPRRSAARAALRATLCSGPAEIEIFDRVFDRLFGQRPPAPLDPGKQGGGPGPTGGGAAAGVTTDAPEGEGGPLRTAGWSAVELLREKSFRAYTAADRRLARAEMRRLAASLPTRPSARWRATRGRGARLDLRRTLRASVRSGGEPRDLRRRTRREKQRRLVFVCDVSGSMAPYAAIALEYAHAVLRAGRRVEVFCFGTRLTRVSREMECPDPVLAICRAEARVADRSGGTRIGAAIAALNREHRHRLGRGAIVVILSDGWDRGEPGLLAAEMERLQGVAHAVLWLDPRLGTPGYEPLTRGMREALPHVRAAFAGDTLAGFEQLTRAERRLG